MNLKIKNERENKREKKRLGEMHPICLYMTVDEVSRHRKYQDQSMKVWYSPLSTRAYKHCMELASYRLYFGGSFTAGSIQMSCVCAKSLQSCLTLCTPLGCRPSGSSVHGILKARIMNWVAIPFSRVSSQPKDQTRGSYVSCIGRRVLYH